MNQIVVRAIREKRLLGFNYDGVHRIVEPHCYGLTVAGNHGLRAFQVGGESNSDILSWKLFNLDRATSIHIVDEGFLTPRAGYKRGDSGMSRIFIEI